MALSDNATLKTPCDNSSRGNIADGDADAHNVFLKLRHEEFNSSGEIDEECDTIR